ncbi:murein hydrolase activator EnvC family protein [Zymomonas mobilis]|uniref:murein hydrolase activator EnvC family protein n=1 Tax=Zymomonas mobilis TaxID=542 RepID=UPI0039ECDA50
MSESGRNSRKSRYFLAFCLWLGCFDLNIGKAGAAVIETTDTGISSYRALLNARKQAGLLKEEAVLAQKESQNFLLKALPFAADIQRLQKQIDKEKKVLSRIEAQRQEQQSELARQRTPLTKLAAALERMARYPFLMIFIQPDNIADIVHLREIIAASRPVIQQKSTSVVKRIAAINSLYQQQEQVIDRIKKDQNSLEEKRQYFLSLAHNGQAQAETWLSQAMYQEDAAIAAEQALKESDGKKRKTLPPKNFCPFPLAAWHIPVNGWISPNSDAEALYLVVEKNTEIYAPQSGIVLYAGDFRSYKQVVIIRHKDGYISLLTGLDKSAVKTNQPVEERQLIGYTAGHPSEIGFQIRRHDETVTLWPDIKEAIRQNNRPTCNFLGEPAQENNIKEKTP